MIKLPWDDPEFKRVWDFWKEYKYREFRKFKFKSVVSEQTALNGLFKKAAGDMKTAIAIIQRSAENRWAGLWEFNTQDHGQATKYPGSGRAKGTSEARIKALKNW